MSDDKQPNQTEVAANPMAIKDLTDDAKDLDTDAENVKGGAVPERLPGRGIPVPLP